MNLAVHCYCLLMLQVNKSSSDFWNSHKLTWQQCSNLPSKFWVTSVAELDGKVYVTITDSEIAYDAPLMYDSNKDQWSTLPTLHYARFSLVSVPEKKQLLAIGGMVNDNGVIVISNKVFLWNDRNRRWTAPYPKMPTARHCCSAISYGSTVIVAGGIVYDSPGILTRAVEVLHINSVLIASEWRVVEQLPYVLNEAVSFIINDTLYLAQGYETYTGPSTCNVVTASLPELLQSNKNTSSGQVWKKLPDMPYSSRSICHYQGRLITFGGGQKVEESDAENLVWQSVPLIHIYNPDTKTWDCVGEIAHGYLLGMSVHIRENKLLFIGGLTGSHSLEDDDDMLATCSILTLSPW